MPYKTILRTFNNTETSLAVAANLARCCTSGPNEKINTCTLLVDQCKMIYKVACVLKNSRFGLAAWPDLSRNLIFTGKKWVESKF